RKKGPRVPLKDLLGLDPDLADFRLAEVAAGAKDNRTLFLCVNGNETPDWRQEKDFLAALAKPGFAVTAVDPRGVGPVRPDLRGPGHAYDDRLCGVEEKVAYNAFLVGKSLLGMRVADVLAAVAEVTAKARQKRLVLCGGRDAALVACLAAAVEPRVSHLAV